MNIRCFQCQHFFNRLRVCLFLGISLFFACQSSPDPSVVKPEKGDIETESRIGPVARPPTPEETFEQLKRENPGNILDDDFRTLRRLVDSKTYLDFLRRNHPLEDRYQTYDAFWEIASAQPSRYMPFLKQALEKPDEELKKLMDGPGMDIAFKHFVDDDRNVLNGLDLVFFTLELTLYVGETERTDAALAGELFDKYGGQDGLIWLALENPVLIGYILKDFTDVEVFRRWRAGEFHQ